MPISEATRHQLHQRLSELIGPEEAATLMEHLPPVGWADVATKQDLEHLRVATKQDLEQVQVAMRGDLENVRVSMQRDVQERLNSSLRWTVGTIFSSYALLAAVGGALAVLLT